METKSDMKKSVNSVSGLRIEQVSGSVESPTDGRYCLSCVQLYTYMYMYVFTIQ